MLIFNILQQMCCKCGKKKLDNSVYTLSKAKNLTILIEKVIDNENNNGDINNINYGLLNIDTLINMIMQNLVIIIIYKWKYLDATDCFAFPMIFHILNNI